MFSLAIESVLAGSRSVAPDGAGFDVERESARFASPAAGLVSLPAAAAASGVAPLLTAAGCVGGVVGVAVDVSVPLAAG